MPELIETDAERLSKNRFVLKQLEDEVLNLRRVMKLALNAINGHLSLGYSIPDSNFQLRAARDEMRAALAE